MTTLSAVAATLTDTGDVSTGEAILFWVFAPVIVVASTGLLIARKAVHAALSVITVMIALAFLYVAQDAPFLGVVQVVVYTGAIMMLFLFVLMLVGVDSSDSLVETIKAQRIWAAVGGLGLVIVLVGVVVTATPSLPQGLDVANEPTNPESLAAVIFGSYAFALEVVGALLVTAALGALVFTHRERLVPRRDQKSRVEARVKALAEGGTVTPLSPPGVYARHNAMDVPALGPDGEPLDVSVNRVLKVRGQEADADDYAARVDRVLAGGWAYPELEAAAPAQLAQSTDDTSEEADQ
ncbi:MAG: NADH-quinone oxidoreductase subunit J [Micrococcales bacterium]|nr:NADH-quinone oxidoreductase subunit J [Micrococcales bacterium]